LAMRAAAVNSIFCFFLLGDGEADVVVVVDDGGGGGGWAGEEDSAEGLGAESNFARRLRRSSAEDEGELLGDVSIALSMFFRFFSTNKNLRTRHIPSLNEELN
jgi:hypothetical protein